MPVLRSLDSSVPFQNSTSTTRVDNPSGRSSDSLHTLGLCIVQADCQSTCFHYLLLFETWSRGCTFWKDGRHEMSQRSNRIFSACHSRKRFLAITARCSSLLARRFCFSGRLLLSSWPFGKYKQAWCPRFANDPGHPAISLCFHINCPAIWYVSSFSQVDRWWLKCGTPHGT